MKSDTLSVLNYQPGVDTRGRPRKGATIPFRVTDREKETLVKWAKSEGVNISQLIRRVVFDALEAHLLETLSTRHSA